MRSQEPQSPQSPQSHKNSNDVSTGISKPNKSNGFRLPLPLPILRLRPRTRRSLHIFLNGIVIGALLTSPFTNLIGSSTPASPANAASPAYKLPQSPQDTPNPDTPTPLDITGTTTPTVIATTSAVPSSTSTITETETTIVTITPTPTTGTTYTPPPFTETPPPTYTVGIPTAPPTLSPIPTDDYTDHAIDSTRDAMLAQVQALPALTGTITGTLVSGSTGGRITSADADLTLGLMPGVVDVTDTINVQVNRVTFPTGDPRATRSGEPIAYTYALSATHPLDGERVSRFNNEVTLVWHIDPEVLVAAGVRGFPLHVYTFNEQGGFWEEILSRWDPQNNQLVATTPHFSTYGVGDGYVDCTPVTRQRGKSHSSQEGCILAANRGEKERCQEDTIHATSSSSCVSKWPVVSGDPPKCAVSTTSLTAC